MTTTLTQARRDLAGALGGYQKVTQGVQYTMPTGTYLGISTAADAARLIITSDLVDLNYAGDGSDTDSNWNNGAFAYLLNTVPEQRRLSNGSYSPSNAASDLVNITTTGFYAASLEMARPMGTAVTAGTVVELHSMLPPLDWDRGEGLHKCINRALMAMPMEYSVSITGAGTKIISLGSTIPWLYRKDQYIGCYDKAADSDSLGRPHPGINPEHPFEFSGNTVSLVSDYVFPSGDTFTLKLWRPVGTWIKTGGTWGDSTVGLVNETDECFADPKIVELCATYYAYKTLAKVHRGVGQGAYYAEQLPEVAALAAPYLRFDNDLHPEERTTGIGYANGYPVIGFPGDYAGSGGGSWP